jgi:hypothetical protein
MLRPTQIGRAAEFLVCYTLQINGIECSHVNSETDIIATALSGRMLRVEVKAATTTKAGRGTYQFLTSKTNNSDWYALVALDIGMMLFMPVSQINTKAITIGKSKFTHERQTETLQQLGAET